MKVIVNGFALELQRNVVTISKDEERMRFTSGEVDSIKSLVNIALGMEQLPALPPSIQNDRFKVNFTEEDTLVLEGLDGREGRLEFTWEEGDNLINAVEEGQRQITNALKLGTAGVVTTGYIDPTPNV